MDDKEGIGIADVTLDPRRKTAATQICTGIAELSVVGPFEIARRRFRIDIRSGFALALQWIAWLSQIGTNIALFLVGRTWLSLLAELESYCGWGYASPWRRQGPILLAHP